MKFVGLKEWAWRNLGMIVMGGAWVLRGEWLGGVSGWCGFSVKKDLVYSPEGWEEELVGDFYRPDVEGEVPVVLLVHGGSWAENDNRYQMRGIAKKLAGEGFAVFNVTYRLAPKWNFPAPVDDLCEALRWLRECSEELGVNIRQVGVYGYSAGGQLVEMLAMRKLPGGLKVNAVVAGATPHYLRLKPDFPVVEVYLGKTFEEAPELYYEASPVDSVRKGFPPVFIYHGMEDELVPPVHAFKFLEKLDDYEVEYEVKWVEGRGHIGTFLFPGGAVGEAVDFLKRKLREELSYLGII